MMLMNEVSRGKVDRGVKARGMRRFEAFGGTRGRRRHVLATAERSPEAGRFSLRSTLSAEHGVFLARQVQPQGE